MRWSPPEAIFTARCTSSTACSSSRLDAINVATLFAPRGRPLGFPLRPLTNGFPLGRVCCSLAVFAAVSAAIFFFRSLTGEYPSVG